MNRKLNLKLLLALLVGSLALVLAVHFVHQYQVARNAEGLLRRAEKAKADGDLVSAVRYQRRYMRYRPNDFEQLAALGLYMKDLTESESNVSFKDIQETFLVIDRAIRELSGSEQPGQYAEKEEELRRAAIEFAMMWGSWQSAIDHLRLLIEQQGENPEPQLQVKLARCYVVNGDQEKGAEVLSTLVGFDRLTRSFTQKATAPNELDAYYLLAVIYRTKVLESDTAESVLAKMIELNPDSHQAYVNRCQYWRAVGESRKEEARADMERALELAPEDDNADVLVLAAEIELDEENLDRAKQALDRGIKSHPEDARFYRLLAAWAAKNRDYDLAKQYVDEGLKKVPGNIDLVWYRANLELEIGEVDDADKSLAALKKMDAPMEFVDLLAAQINMARAKWLEASEQLERVRPVINRVRPTMVALVERGLAQCYEMLGQPDKMLSAYQNLALADPDDQAARWGLIKANLRAGQTKAAIDAHGRLARELERRQEEVNPRFLPNQLEILIAKQLQLPEDQRDWSEADGLMANIRKTSAIADVDKVKMQVALLEKKGEHQRADELLRRARQVHKGDLTLRLAAVDEAYQKEGFDAAWGRLDELEREFGDGLVLRTARAHLLAQGGGVNAKDGLLRLEEGAEGFSDTDQAALWWTLASIHYAMQDRPTARRLFQKLAQKRGDDVNVRLALFELAKEMNDEKEVAATLSDLRRLVGPTSADYKACEASHLVWQVRNQAGGSELLSRARDLLKQARQLRPNWERLDRLESEIFLAQDDPDAAVSVLKRAIDSGQDNPIIKRQLVRLLLKLDRLPQAREVLETLPVSQRTAEEHRIARVLEGDLLDESSDQLVLHRDSVNPDDHLVDAQTLLLAKRWDEAEAALHRAVRTGPALSHTWLSLVRFLSLRGRLEEAEEVIRQAQNQLPEYLVPILVGQCYEAIGQRDQALHFFTRAYHVNPDDLLTLRALATFYLQGSASADNAYTRTKQIDQARHHLQRMVDVAEDNPSQAHPHAAWARRAMAQLRAPVPRSTQDRIVPYRDFVEALRLIEKNAGPEGDLAPEDLLLWASLSSARPDPTFRKRAIERLEAAEQKRNLTKGERLVLAELYEKTNQKWDRCRAIMEELVANDEKDLAVLAVWMDWLLERNATEEVQKLLEKHLEPDSKFAKRVRAELLVRAGRKKEATDIVKSLLPDPLPTKAEESVVLLEAARLTEQLARQDPSLLAEAEDFYRQFALRHPAGKLELAVFLGRQRGSDRLDEAFRLCREALSGQPAELIVQTALSIVREQMGSIPSEAKYWSQLEQWIQRERQRSPDSVTLALQHASFEEIRGNVKAAEEIYRQFLSRSDADAYDLAVAANNLAFLLALQQHGNEASSLIEKAIKELGPINDILDTRALVYLAQKQPAQAKKDLVQVISGGSQSPDVFFHLALAEHMLQNPSDARTALQRAIELGLSVDRVKPIERRMLQRLAQQLGVDLSTASRAEGSRLR